jgi:hypothetical protein
MPDYLDYHRKAWDAEYARQGGNRPGFGVEPLYKKGPTNDTPPPHRNSPWWRLEPNLVGAPFVLLGRLAKGIAKLLGVLLTLATALAATAGLLYVSVWVIHALWRAT